jgi:hypothetical protein
MSHHPGTIYRAQPTSTGAIMVVSTGAAIRDQNVVVHTTLSLTLKNHGLSVLNPAAAARFTLAAPVKGCKKEILCYTTLANKVKTHSTACTINNTTNKTFTFGSTGIALARQGVMIELTGGSTVNWYAVVNSPSTVKAKVTLTTST